MTSMSSGLILASSRACWRTFSACSLWWRAVSFGRKPNAQNATRISLLSLVSEYLRHEMQPKISQWWQETWCVYEIGPRLHTHTCTHTQYCDTHRKYLFCRKQFWLTTVTLIVTKISHTHTHTHTHTHKLQWYTLKTFILQENNLGWHEKEKKKRGKKNHREKKRERESILISTFIVYTIALASIINHSFSYLGLGEWCKCGEDWTEQHHPW